MESVGLGRPRWLGSSWRRGIAESGSSQLLTLMIATPGDLVWDLPCMQQAGCLEGGPLLWIWPLYLHVNQKSDDDEDIRKPILTLLHSERTKLYAILAFLSAIGLNRYVSLFTHCQLKSQTYCGTFKHVILVLGLSHAKVSMYSLVIHIRWLFLVCSGCGLERCILSMMFLGPNIFSIFFFLKSL